MTLVVLFLLAVVWAIYLASWFRSRAPRRNVNSISSFSRHLSVLERTSPATAVRRPVRYSATSHPSAMSKGEARRRRRDVLYVLGGAAMITLLGAVVLGGPIIWVHLMTDVALVGYVALLARSQHLAHERSVKVRYLVTPESLADGAYYAAQSASAR